jgi:cell division protein FtsB
MMSYDQQNVDEQIAVLRKTIAKLEQRVQQLERWQIDSINSILEARYAPAKSTP